MNAQPARLRRPWRRLVVAFAACLAVTLTALAGDAFAATSAVPRRLSNPLEVQTVPVVAGLEFEFRGEAFVTDSKGRFVIPTSLLPPEIAVPTVGFTVVVKRLHLRPNRSADGVVYHLERFYQRFHTVAPGNRARVVLAALNAYVPVRFAFLDRLGERIDPGLFQSMVVKRIDGAVFKLDRRDVYGGAELFRASRVVPLTGGLLSKALDYRIQSVTVGGNNVVNRAQQAFTPLRERCESAPAVLRRTRVRAGPTVRLRSRHRDQARISRRHRRPRGVRERPSGDAARLAARRLQGGRRRLGAVGGATTVDHARPGRRAQGPFLSGHPGDGRPAVRSRDRARHRRPPPRSALHAGGGRAPARRGRRLRFERSRRPVLSRGPARATARTQACTPRASTAAAVSAAAGEQVIARSGGRGHKYGCAPVVLHTLRTSSSSVLPQELLRTPWWPGRTAPVRAGFGAPSVLGLLGMQPVRRERTHGL